MKKLRVADIVTESIIDGKGLRAVIFAQGCKRFSKGCHNLKLRDLKGGRYVFVEEIVKNILENPLITGITFSGGEPLLQPEPFTEIAKLLHNAGLDVMCYTGYTFEDLLKGGKYYTPRIFRLLKNLDLLVDGEFIEKQKSLLLKFKGSKNQRIIDVPNSLKENRTVVVG